MLEMKLINLIRPMVEEIMKEESVISAYLETYVDGKQMLGTDGTTILRSGDNTNKAVENHKANLIRLSKQVKTYLKEADSIEIRLVSRDGRVIRKYDITADLKEN
jgi:hypothetical protein